MRSNAKLFVIRLSEDEAFGAYHLNHAIKDYFKSIGKDVDVKSAEIFDFDVHSKNVMEAFKGGT